MATASSSRSTSKPKALLLSYCKKILSDISTQKEQSQDNVQKEIILNVYQEKCSRLIDEINSLDPEALSFVVLADNLQKVAQLVLDLTYVEECCLVDHDFLLQAAYERVTNIIETLSGIETLTSEASPGNHPGDVLSPSIAECIHWRKGALLYMYCHTLNARCSREELPPHFCQCLQDGSQHMIAMLSTRGSPQWLSDDPAPPGESGTATRSAGDDGDMLFSQGIYSDTHLLALMYLGEMCYWYAQLTAAQPGSSQQLTPSPSQHAQQGQTRDSKPVTASAAVTEPRVTLVAEEKPAPPAPSRAARQEARRTAEGEAFSPPQATALRDQQACSTNPGLSQGESLDMLKIGQSCLENYVRAAKGPMNAGGWNTNRAEEILEYFETLSI